MEKATLLLSIRPKYAEKIFNGTKKFELRRVRPNVKQGDIILVYVSSPEKKIKATLRVNKVVSDDLENLWELVQNDAGVDKHEFDSYFSGKEIGIAIEISEVNVLSTPLQLADIRKLLPEFNPPQLYKYLPADETSLLLNNSPI